MRAILLTLALAACASDAPLTSVDLHEIVPCDSDWTGGDYSDGCEAACQSRSDLSSDPFCKVDIDVGGLPVETACEETYIQIENRRGCCVEYQGSAFSGVRFHECK
ncbi:MAG TPA: hypothetical protein VM493_10235 [Vicinamibacterales bacterium]|nr:hypothetical protein [Vicinamibacterales bacterium]